jgi:myxalamid-type polyketide synthase MxaE and MxaD
VLPLSAHNPEALQKLSEAFQGLLSGQPQDALNDICYTASVHRNHFAHRLTVVGQTPQEMVDKIKIFQQKRFSTSDLSENEISSGHQILFLFSPTRATMVGHGPVIAERTSFRQSIEQCTSLFNKYADWSLWTE